MRFWSCILGQNRGGIYGAVEFSLAGWGVLNTFSVFFGCFECAEIVLINPAIVCVFLMLSCCFNRFCISCNRHEAFLKSFRWFPYCFEVFLKPSWAILHCLDVGLNPSVLFPTLKAVCWNCPEHSLDEGSLLKLSWVFFGWKTFAEIVLNVFIRNQVCWNHFKYFNVEQSFLQLSVFRWNGVSGGNFAVWRGIGIEGQESGQMRVRGYAGKSRHWRFPCISPKLPWTHAGGGSGAEGGRDAIPDGGKIKTVKITPKPDGCG